jgi:hypothetical protein
MISFTSSGSFAKTQKFLKAMQKLNINAILEKAGRDGVRALSAATPVNSGLVARSWYYEVSKQGTTYTISWRNSDIEDGFPVAIMLQYGHGTGTGGYIQGIDYINPAIRPIFDRIANEVWKAVTSA